MITVGIVRTFEKISLTYVVAKVIFRYRRVVDGSRTPFVTFRAEIAPITANTTPHKKVIGLDVKGSPKKCFVVKIGRKPAIVPQTNTPIPF